MKSDITLYLEKGIAEKSRLPHCSILISYKFQVLPPPKQVLAPEEKAPCTTASKLVTNCKSYPSQNRF